MPLVDRHENPLDKCKMQINNWTELYKMQLKYLSIPATSIPSE